MKLPGEFVADKAYLLSGATLNAWREALMADRIIAGPGLKESSGGKTGRILTVASAPATPGGGDPPPAAVGAFFGIYQEGGHTYLQGGSVTGGHGGSASISAIKVIDATTGPIAPAGYVLYLEVSATATLYEGILLPGCQVDSASTGTASELPAAHAFTVAQPSGELYAELGQFTATSFLPAAPGNVHASGCIGNFQLSRE